MSIFYELYIHFLWIVYTIVYIILIITILYPSEWKSFASVIRARDSGRNADDLTL